MCSSDLHLHNLFHKLSFTKSCANAIEVFHQALDGCTFRHEKVGNKGNDMLNYFRINHRPMAIPYNPPIQQIKHEFKHELLHEICQT